MIGTVSLERPPRAGGRVVGHVVWWGPLQSLAGQCSDTTFTSKGGPVTRAGMAPRRLRTGGQRRSRGVGQAGWDGWEREEARAELGEPGRVRAPWSSQGSPAQRQRFVPTDS